MSSDQPSLERLRYSNFSSRVRTPSETHAEYKFQVDNSRAFC